ncbi:hypothetical protein BKA57DRAFT_508337 [Linnemannia elongata]|nr:hypothetical protein BKA57DRAFT_508337 [Linnemannia elongata]
MSTPPAPGKAPPMVLDLAFVDDTSLVGPGHTKLTRMTDVGTEFFGMHGIEINGKKTELLAINPTYIDNNYGGSLIQPQVASKASRVLGVWPAADGSAKTTAAMAMKETETVCGILLRKSITDKQCIYIINAVLILRLLYRMTAQIPAWTVIERITKKYRTVVRQKLGLPSSTQFSILHHTRLYGLRALKDALAEQHISTLHLRSTQKGLIGDLTHSRLQDLQRAARLRESPLSNPAIASTYTQHNLIARGDRVWFAAVCQAISEFPQIEVNRVEEREEEYQGHAYETQEHAEEEEEFGNEDENRISETTRTIDLLQQTPEKPRIPWTPPKATGNKAVDRANLRAFKQRRNQIIDRHSKIRREKEVRVKPRQQAAKVAAEEEKRRKKTEKQAELDRRGQELERALTPKRRLMLAQASSRHHKTRTHVSDPTIKRWLRYSMTLSSTGGERR